MVFAALTSALVVRRGLSDDWLSMPKPTILWVNTVVLLASSFALEIGRRALHSGARAQVQRLVDHSAPRSAWPSSAARSSPGNNSTMPASSSPAIPSNSFFYVFTFAHAFHLLGGVSALFYVDVQALRLSLGPAKRTAIDVSAIFWHFLDGLWVYLMVLFYVWG